MTLSRDPLLDPDQYDRTIYRAMHQVMDRIVELGSKADTSEDTSDEEDSKPRFVDILRSQANFTPAERAEFHVTSEVLNLLINMAVARRSGLYQPPS